MTIALLLALLLTGGWLWTPDADRQALEARYAAAPSRFVQAAGLRVHLRDTGPLTSNPGGKADAPAVLLLHGFGSSLQTWDTLARDLEGEFRVLRIDLPGAGLTGADPSGDYSDERGMQVLAALLDTLGLQRVALLGHSMGGRLAWRFAAEQPQRVASLVLMAPDGFASPGFDYGKPPDVGLSVQLMRHVLPKPLVRMGLQPAFADPAQVTDALVDRYHDLMLAPGVRGALIERMQQMRLVEPTPFLRRIGAPVLLLWGAQDQMVPVANAQDYLRVLPAAELVVLPGVGHLPQEEAPAQALPALRTFLSRTLASDQKTMLK
jgi:pimeloyl-ACP methyl ester carboxylesterase